MQFLKKLHDVLCNFCIFAAVIKQNDDAKLNQIIPNTIGNHTNGLL